jgi:hypothetical protein
MTIILGQLNATSGVFSREPVHSSSSASQEIPLHCMGPESSMQYLQHPLPMSWDRWSASTPLSFLFKIRFNTLIPSMPVSSNWSFFFWWFSEKRANCFSDQISCFNLKFMSFCLLPVPKILYYLPSVCFLVKMAVTVDYEESYRTLRDNRSSDY